MMNDDAYDHDADRDNDHGNRSRSRRKLYLWTGLCLLLVVVVVIISVVLATNSSGGSASGENGSGYSEAQLSSLIQTAYSNVGIDPTPLSTQNSPAWLALQWLTSDKLQTTETTVLIQRFALATFYFATYSVATAYVTSPQPWTSSNLWLSDQSECGWEGVLCSPHGTVLGISLESNGLSGGLPMELALLRDHFSTLDLSSNLLFMNGTQLDVFAKLSNLGTFLLDNNYIYSTTGLPTQLAGLTNLLMLRLSYNLLQGPLNGTLLAGLTQLTHLEVESNFISGTMPSQVGHLTSLVYFYFRRNSMKFNLNFVKPGQMSNLCKLHFSCCSSCTPCVVSQLCDFAPFDAVSMWLDDNTITGTLPTQLALLTNLASLSLTNASITGTIPTQMGTMSNMQRLWLYTNQLHGKIPTQFGNLTQLSVFEVQQNHLSGTMPKSLCPIIATSTYAKKSLACDCKNKTVVCTCCTSCY
jgi:Leucine-rich repeat (LRR) protein